jgi:hypothetical protein
MKLMAKNDHEIKKLISILMESPLYMTLSLSERRSLLERLTQSYPNLNDEEDEQREDHFE